MRSLLARNLTLRQRQLDLKVRVLRGGSWNNKPKNLRSANRNRNTTTKRNNNNGFRLLKCPYARVGTLIGGAKRVAGV